jgi:hypothetical protein
VQQALRELQVPLGQQAQQVQLVQQDQTQQLYPIF